jgi:hypothetical protein
VGLYNDKTQIAGLYIDIDIDIDIDNHGLIFVNILAKA